jgi:LacI family transcriptional regulator
VPTINDVAKRANVSPVTVSRVLNGAPNVHEATRTRVNQAIAELGYVPNVVARSLRSRRTRSIALILPDITNPFWPTVARGVEDAAQHNGYTVLLCNSDENTSKQARYLEVVISQQVDGVLIAPADSDAANLAPLRERRVPTVVLDRRVDGWDVDTVRGDSVGGARMLTRHLIELGHRRIAMLTGPASTSTSQDRLEGYETALRRAGIDYDEELVRFGEFRQSSGQEMAQAVLSMLPPPTAIFGANNAIALGALAAIGERGQRVPQDVALVCFDDVSPSSQLFPFLTVAEQPAYQMGFEAAGLLFGRLDDGEAAPARDIILPGRLIVRLSCGTRPGEALFSLPLPQPATAGKARHLTGHLSSAQGRDLSGLVRSE